MGYLMNFIDVFFWPIIFLLVIFMIIMIFSWWKLFEKAKIDGYKALIPLYNLYLFLNIAELPIFFIPIFFIPILNIIVFWIASIRLGNLFGKKKFFQIGMCILPFLFYPILGLSDSLYKAEEERGRIHPKDKNTTMYNQFPEVSDTVSEIVSDNVLSTPIKPITPILDPVATVEEVQNLEPIPTIEETPNTVEPLSTVENGILQHDNLILDVDSEDTTWQDQKKLTEAEETLKVVTIDPLKDDPLFNPEAKPVKAASLDHYKVCPNCGARLDVDAQICFLCGKQIQNSGE